MKWGKCAVCFLLCTLMAGCAPHGREPDGLALARALGVDGGTVRAVCIDGQGTCAVEQATGADFAAARAALPGTGERKVALTNLSYIIIGKGTDLEAVLTAILNDRELSPGAQVWCAEDAGELLEQGAGALGRLEVLAGERMIPTVAEALAALETEGRVELPRLVLKETGIEEEGTAGWEKKS